VERAYDAAIDGKVWDELKDELPDRMVDAHVHCYRAGDSRCPGPVNPSLPFTTKFFSFERCERVSSLLWRGKSFRCVAFNMPAPGSDTRAGNRWVAGEAKKRDWPSLALIRPEWTAEEVAEALDSGGHAGVKPYWNYVTHKAQNDVTIEDMVRPDVLEMLESRGLPLLLHLPRAGRLACPVNLASLHRLCRRFPGLTIIIAHAGRSYGPDQMPPVAELRKLARHDNLRVEFSMVQSVEVVRTCLETFGWQRCLFGTDQPISGVKGKVVTINGQNLFITLKPYPWSVSPGSAVKMRCTFFAYEIARAIVTAARQLRLRSAARDALFCGNAEALYRCQA
jgi:predicted TIM-barrel fold metal-dependent hydrolase